MKHFRSMMAGFERLFKGLVSKPVNHVKLAHSMIDMLVEVLAKKGMKDKISCKAGCAACCQQLIRITASEGKILASAIRDGKIHIDEGKLKRQAKTVEAKSMDQEGWANKEPEFRKCVFLTKDNLCSAYAIRPIACRNYRVISDPKYCDLSYDGPIKVKILNDMNASVLASAFIYSDLNGSLPSMVYKEL